jgi:hypothetical protein
MNDDTPQLLLLLASSSDQNKARGRRRGRRTAVRSAGMAHNARRHPFHATSRFFSLSLSLSHRLRARGYLLFTYVEFWKFCHTKVRVSTRRLVTRNTNHQQHTYLISLTHLHKYNQLLLAVVTRTTRIYIYIEREREKESDV